jgi:hypothetical protein
MNTTQMFVVRSDRQECLSYMGRVGNFTIANRARTVENLFASGKIRSCRCKKRALLGNKPTLRVTASWLHDFRERPSRLPLI